MGVAFIQSKADQHLSKETTLVKNEASDSHNTKPYVTAYINSL